MEASASRKSSTSAVRMLVSRRQPLRATASSPLPPPVPTGSGWVDSSAGSTSPRAGASGFALIVPAPRSQGGPDAGGAGPRAEVAHQLAPKAGEQQHPEQDQQGSADIRDDRRMPLHHHERADQPPGAERYQDERHPEAEAVRGRQQRAAARAG